MPLDRLLQRASLDQDAVQAVRAAFELALTNVVLPAYADGELLAAKLVEAALGGERDPENLVDLALQSIKNASPSRR